MRKIDWINIFIGAACIILVLAAFFHLSHKIDQLPAQVEERLVSDISEVVRAEVSDKFNVPPPSEYAIPMPVPVVPEITFEPEPEEPEWVCPLPESDVALIANLVKAEADNQEEYGQRLVIDTVLNRLDSDRYPDAVEEVLYQRNQYYPEGHEVYSRTPDEKYIELVYDELKERTNYDVFFFRTEHYHKFGTPLFQVGDHYFSTL